MDTDALIERLERKQKVYNGLNTFRDELVNPDGPEAAARIKSLEARIEAAEKRAETLRDDDILAWAESARRAVCKQPVGFWIDPGAGSAMDRFQRNEPTPEQCCDMARRGGHYELLYTGTSVEQMIIHVVRAAAQWQAGQEGEG